MILDIENVLNGNMRLMTTKKGSLSWAHLRAQKGDQIFVLHGCSMPVVLRPASNSNPRIYTLVGDAFLENMATSISGSSLRQSLEDFDFARFETRTVIRETVRQIELADSDLISENILPRGTIVWDSLPPLNLILHPSHAARSEWDYLEIC
ncbi:uncharacterized protein LY89DRAFT_689143 [Mollisia scopiformis]|uniref:Uncharacterized protein n=1 Tax=Mollisia scopiformis TaxID=149040 RepID=A0A194WTG1_MOLSC|nr:uncharacterized protein LY89DRAFT_689143 [Mollisia scopiformis]KUJ11248.1 hypothetical protein LY89DRAFT_689143 [Mollisia scopiformis]